MSHASSHSHSAQASAAKLALKVSLPPALAKRYSLIRELGQGAYGLVWCVSDSVSTHQVAHRGF